ncbi:clathrin light chain B-like [Antedon mediterranea]|uniref:clathrin light chain B-like n=1 Tax=Antedon mediterranea TaxID=105859 RepID=UPI003AF85626
MADFLDVDGGINPNSAPVATEEDPAAAFLAREQDELAGIEDENFSGGPTTDAQAVDQGNADFGSAEADILGGGEVGGEAPQENGPSDAYSAISSVDRLANEPEKIKKWRVEQEELLAKKDEEADELKEDWRETAKKELNDWYNKRSEQQEKMKTSNRASEEAFIQERDEDIPGQEWERVARLCDFNPKNSKTTKDVTRMRSLLLHLKQTGLTR